MKINRGEPTKNGVYVCYVEISSGYDFLEKRLLTWLDNQWSYTGSGENCTAEVYGFIGPLPSPKKKDLVKKKIKKFAIGILPDIMHGAFMDGPFDSIKDALDTEGEEGQFIATVTIDKAPKLTYSWDEPSFEWKRL